ncbi:GDYXXLXY domain-containing protein [Hymenobacter sp. ASUV-10]|uniref:GDYXXLXY domain-containing protein n=1 Tax=Hymenobacter aranciens TaxID=3063996 RepID=A0ABT9BAB5_9BACT|nr:GDYXXLXY domain-containing protein [Hymenobacter sp. ASUV-10]MDO7875210.1 GDYXXLXY domain-containing protein [Hymenobacter sp. ASUV-10]
MPITILSAGRRRLLQLLLAAQVLYVLGVAGAGYATSALGQHLQLRAAPINPAELQTGNYVRLSYDIGNVPLTAWRATTPPQRRQQVYVLLHTATPDSAATVAGVYDQTPTASTGQAVLRGWVETVQPRRLRLRFNLERYYVPAASPLRREKPRRLHPLLVSVSVAPWGQARITAVQLRRTEPRPDTAHTQLQH